jgi:hypothetical protein
MIKTIPGLTSISWNKRLGGSGWMKKDALSFKFGPAFHGEGAIPIIQKILAVIEKSAKTVCPILIRFSSRPPDGNVLE